MGDQDVSISDFCCADCSLPLIIGQTEYTCAKCDRTFSVAQIQRDGLRRCQTLNSEEFTDVVLILRLKGFEGKIHPVGEK